MPDDSIQLDTPLSSRQDRATSRRSFLAASAGLIGVGSAAGFSGSALADSAGESDLAFAPVTDLARRIRRGELSAEHLVEVFLERIEARDDDVNAFITLLPDRAREAAREADAAVERGDDLGPLHGVPFAVKDSHAVEGVPTTSGVLPFRDDVAESTDPFVQRLIDAGGIVIGTVSLPEFGHYGETHNLINGATATPFDVDRTAGGSSGGSAAAVAAGLVPFATGTDAAGSIRIPASFTGTYGLFPGPEHDGEFDEPGFFSQSGVQTRTVRDTALLLSLSRPNDGLDYLGALERDIQGTSIGYDLTPGDWPVDPAVRERVEETVATVGSKTGAPPDHAHKGSRADVPPDHARAGGVRIEEMDVEFDISYDEIIHVFRVTWSSGLAQIAESIPFDVLGEDSHLFTEHFRQQVEVGQQFLGPDGELVDTEFQRTLAGRRSLWDGFQNAFEEYDLLVTPTVATPPFPHEAFGGPTEIDGVEINPTYGWVITAMANLTGLPGASVPAGVTDDGLPVGMAIFGPPNDTESVIAASAAYERASPWHEQYPGVRG